MTAIDGLHTLLLNMGGGWICLSKKRGGKRMQCGVTS